MTWERTLADLVEERTGIALAPRQLRQDVRRRIDARIAELGLRGPEAWVWDLARRPASDPEFAWLVDAVTVGYSYFFRDSEQLDVVIEVLAEASRRRRGRTHTQVWCAGCSHGQEPWSLAILADRARLPIQVLATDLNPASVERARRGEYPDKAMDPIPESLRHGLRAIPGGVRVRDDLRGVVRFAQHNLVGAGPYPFSPDGGRFDLILCRNVFIYFSPTVRQRVASRFARALEPDGWLFLGPGETLDDVEAPLVARPWGRRTGYCPALAGGPLRPSMVPDAPKVSLPPRPMPATDALDGLLARVGSEPGPELEGALAQLAATEDGVRSWTALAHVRIRLHDLSGALEACDRAAGCDPLDARPHLAAGVASRKLGDLPAAERSLRQALFLDPDCWPAGFLLAGVYGRLGRDRERRLALRRSREALARAPDTPTDPPSFGVESLDRSRLRRRLRAEIPSD